MPPHAGHAGQDKAPRGEGGVGLADEGTEGLPREAARDDVLPASFAARASSCSAASAAPAGRASRGSPYATRTDMAPMPSMEARITSPGRTGPTPSGVPVRRMSPGSSV